jgi:streptomycin 6-kinase
VAVEVDPVLTVPNAFAEATRAREGAAGAEWLSALPALVGRLLTRWGLELDGRPLHGYVALVLRVRTPDGQPAVLKVSWIDDETRVEAVALARWSGVPAVALLASAPEDGALLLERLDPHRSLLHVDEDEAVAVAATLLRQLHVPPADGLTSVTDIARRLATELREEWQALGQPGPRHLVEQAVSTCDDLAGSPGAARLLHGDFHYGNVLARVTPAARPAQQPWAAIDPKPLVGDREYDVVPLLRNRWDELAATGDPARACRRRLAAIVDRADLDRSRAQRWSLVRSVDDALWAHEHRAGDFAAVAWAIAAALR